MSPLFNRKNRPETLAEARAADLKRTRLDRLHAITEQQLALEVERASTIKKLRRKGATWKEIADVLGVTPQAAQKRYGR